MTRSFAKIIVACVHLKRLANYVKVVTIYIEPIAFPNVLPTATYQVKLVWISKTLFLVPNINYNIDPQYLVKAFYDTISTLDTQISDIVGSPTDLGGNNWNTGEIFGYLPGKRVLGGALNWHKASFTKTFSNLNPHYGYRFKIKIYLGEGRGSFVYTITGKAPVTITAAMVPSESINLWGRSTAEKIHDIDTEVFLTNGGNSISVFLSYVGDSNVELGFGAVSDYFLILYLCMPFCN